jgi:hypothetical protein
MEHGIPRRCVAIGLIVISAVANYKHFVECCMTYPQTLLRLALPRPGGKVSWGKSSLSIHALKSGIAANDRSVSIKRIDYSNSAFPPN